WQSSKELKTLPHPAHLLLGVRTEELAEVRAAGFRDLRSELARRLAFLGVNHRNPALANDNLRRFLGHAVERERLLNEHFRGTPGGLGGARPPPGGCPPVGPAGRSNTPSSPAR